MKKRTKRYLIIFICVFVLIAIIVISPLFPYVRSLTVMKAYSEYCNTKGIPKTEGIELEIPGGSITKEKDWYPFVMNFDADSTFSGYIGEYNSRLTILYNFPQFDLSKGCSKIYDTNSPLYNSFYGAYFVKSADGIPFGFDKNGILKEESVVKIAKIDFFSLVLGDMGLERKNRIFDYKIIDYKDDMSFVGYDGWTRIDAKMEINGACHEKKEFKRSYLQYGSPNYKCKQDFAPVNMICTVIGKYFPKKNTSLFFYVMCSDEDECEKCVNKILSKSKLKFEC